MLGEVAVLVLVGLGEGLGGGEEVVEVPVVLGRLDPVLLQPVRAEVDTVIGDNPGQGGDLVVDGDGLPGDRQHVLVVLPLLALRGEILEGAHALELAHPVVPHLAAVGWTAGGDRGDELLPGLRLGHELHLDLEVLLRLVEALDERLHEGIALGLGHAELEADRSGPPRSARPDQGLLPPGEVRRREGTGGGHGLQDLSAREDAALVHACLLLEILL